MSAPFTTSALPPAARPPARDLVEVATWSPEALEDALRTLPCPDPAEIAPWEWDGYNLHPAARLLGFRKFKKGFLPAGDILHGYNVKVVQGGGPLDPWVARRDAGGRPLRHGFFNVVPPCAPDDRYRNALLLDYACGRNPAWDPAGLLRDYLVAVAPDTLLGKAYFALGERRVPAGYFVLQRSDRAEPV